MNDRGQTMPGFTACKLTQWPNLDSQCNSGTYIAQSLEVNKKISNHNRFKSLNAFIKFIAGKLLHDTR